MTVHKYPMENSRLTPSGHPMLDPGSSFADDDSNIPQRSYPDENEELVNSLLEMSPYIISITTLREGRLLRVNKRWCDALGYHEKQAIGHTHAELGIYIDPEDRKNLLTAIKAQEKIEDFETRISPKNRPPYATRLNLKKIRYQGQKCLLAMTTYSSVLAESENTAQQSENRFRNILNSIHESYYEVDLKGNVIVFNNSISALFGRSCQELSGMNFRAYTVTEDIPKVLKAYNEVYEGKCEINFIEYGIYHKDGPPMQVEASACLLRDKTGQPIGFYGVIRDRTQQKAAEDALRRSEEKYRGILEEMEEGYYEVDLEANFTYYNQAFLKMHGYSAEEFAGMNLTHYTVPEQANKILHLFITMYETGIPINYHEYEIVHKDGSIRFFELSGYPRRDQVGDIIGFWGITRDRTKQRKAEMALLRSEEKYRNILENMDEGFYEFDLKGTFTDFNSATCRLYGYSAEATSQKTMAVKNAKQN